MSHVSTNSVCGHALTHILRKSAAIIQDNETVKEKLFPHTNEATHGLTDNLMRQMGVNW